MLFEVNAIADPQARMLAMADKIIVASGKKKPAVYSNGNYDYQNLLKRDDIDAVIIGMHAREDNPELQKAKSLGLKIFSYPEYIYEQTKNKTRVVIGGSHGKTSITAMILHVLQASRFPIDYMVGAQLRGFDTMVKITDDAKTIILEGDEYLSSPIDRRPKFHLYKGHVAVLSGIAWDHINVFPTFEIYLQQFEQFIVEKQQFSK